MRMLKNLPDFLKHYSSRGGGHEFSASSSKEAGSPHTIVVTSAGLRAADVARYAILLTGETFSCNRASLILQRVLRIFQTKESAVAKLFAKHIKLKDAIDHVKKTRYVRKAFGLVFNCAILIEVAFA